MRPTVDQAQATHDSQFTSVTWFGKNYAFSPAQGKCVKALWNFWMLGTPVIREEMVMEIAGVKARRLKDVFNTGPGKAAWGTMIGDGDRRGTVRLIEPGAPEAAGTTTTP
jgi:hypothetical protein